MFTRAYYWPLSLARCTDILFCFPKLILIVILRATFTNFSTFRSVIELKLNHAEGEEYSETMHSFECDYTEVGSGGRIAFVTAIHLQAEVSVSVCPSLQYLNTLMTALHNIVTLLFVFLCIC